MADNASASFDLELTGGTVSQSLAEQIGKLNACTLRLLRRAETVGRPDLTLKAIREARANMELLARLTGALDEAPVLVQTVVVMPGPSDEPEPCLILDLPS